PFAVDLERIGLAAAAIQGRHQLRTKPLAERMPADELAQLSDEGIVAVQSQICVDAILERLQPQLLEPLDVGFCEGFVREVIQCRAPPECKPRAKTLCRRLRVPVRQQSR